MNCSDIQDRIIEFVEGTLPNEDNATIKQHLASCETCKSIYEQTLAIHQTFDKVEDELPSSQLRSNFFEMLEEEKQLQPSKVVQLNKTDNFNWKYAFQIAASFLLLFVGYYFGNFNAEQDASNEIAQLKEQTIELKENMMLAMLENRSASKRIQAVNYSEDLIEADTAIVEALIERMQFDSNINVRLAAAEALYKFSDSELVKTAFISALETEKEPDLQIAIIQFLVNIQEKRAIAPMQQLLEQPETPDFVKAQANSGISQII